MSAKVLGKIATLLVAFCFPILLSAADTDTSATKRRTRTATASQVESQVAVEVIAKTSHTEEDGDHVTIARGRFTDQSKHGTLKIERVPFTKLKIKGTSSDEIVIVSEWDQKGRPRVDAEGFRRLDERNTFDLVEKDNVVAIQLPQGISSGDIIPEFTIFLPRDTHLDIDASFSLLSSSVEVANIRGDLIVRGRPQKIELDNLSGTILIEVGDSKVSAEFDKSPTKPISISSQSRIELELPSDAKADLLLQTKSGKIRTNFSEKKLQMNDPESKKTANSRPLYQATGKLNGGGVKIHLVTDSGSITIKEDD